MKNDTGKTLHNTAGFMENDREQNRHVNITINDLTKTEDQKYFIQRQKKQYFKNTSQNCMEYLCCFQVFQILKSGGITGLKGQQGTYTSAHTALQIIISLRCMLRVDGVNENKSGR